MVLRGFIADKLFQTTFINKHFSDSIQVLQILIYMLTNFYIWTNICKKYINIWIYLIINKCSAYPSH